jgi:SAM-dependent methyltransferase
LAAELPIARLKAATTWMWSQGDYAAVAPRLEPCAIKLAEACGVAPGMAVLDVAAGNGNFALAAAARGGAVIAIDLTPRMVELGRARTEAAGTAVDWRVGDAEELPLPDGGFDVVASVFGAMFAPRPDRVAAELFRVCRPGGLVAMANYGWDGFLGATSKLLSRYSNRLPFELPSPFEWGDASTVRRRFDGLASSDDIQPDTLTMTFDSLDAGVEFWERTNGPMIALRATIEPERYAECRRELRGLMDTMNASRDAGVTLTSSYLRVVARR